MEDMEGQGNLRSWHDEVLLVMIKMGIRDGSLCDEKIRFVFQDEADETSCIANKRRAFEETSKGGFEHGAAGSGTFRQVRSQSLIETGKSYLSFFFGGEVSGTLAVIGTPGRTRPAIDGRNKGRVLRLLGMKRVTLKAPPRMKYPMWSL